MPRATDSTTKFKADITDFKASMQEAARLVRLANSEFKAATSGMKNWSSSADGLSAKIKQLNTTLDAQKRQLATLETEYQKVAQEQGENSKGAQELQIKINNQKAAIKNTEAALDSYADQLNEVENESKETAEQTKKTSDGFTVMKGVLADLAATAIKAVVNGLKNIATEAFNAGANFESAMSKVAAVSGANKDEIAQLTAKAKEMGETTKFSATEAAEAFNYMAMAGWKTEDMIDGISGIMNLAAASGSDLATTSDIVTDALTAMGYSAKDAGRLADVMAAASSNANTNVEMMGLTFQYAAPIIGALGMNMEDAAVAIGLMANAGIKGEKSGTALRSILTRLAAPPAECAKAMDELGVSLTDSDGKMKSLDQVMQDLRKAFADLSETEQTTNAKHIAGQEAMSGLLAIVNAAPEDFDKLTEAVKESEGAAQSMADTMNDNVQGQLTLLKSNIEGKMIKVFEKASPAIKRAVHQISKALDQINWDKVAKGVGNLASKFADFITYLVKNGDKVKNILKGIGTAIAAAFVVSKISAFVKALGTVIPAISAMSTPLTLVLSLITALGTAMAIWTQKHKEAMEAQYGLTDAQKELTETINENREAQQQLIDEREKSVQGIAGEYNYIRQLKDEYNKLIDSNGQVKKGYEDRAEFILTELAKALGVERDEINKQIEANGKLGESIDELIIKKQAEATLAAYDSSYADAKQNEKKYLDEVVQSQLAYNDAVDKEKAAKDRLLEAQQKVNEAMQIAGSAPDLWIAEMQEAAEAHNITTQAVNDTKAALDNANQSYIEAQTTVQNYQGLSQAIIAGDVDAINAKINELTNGFKGASSSTRQELEQQVADYQKYYNDIKAAMDSGNPVITQSMVNGAKDMVTKAKAELDKLPKEFTTTGTSSTDAYVKGLQQNNSGVQQSGKQLTTTATEGAKSELYGIENAGRDGGRQYSAAVESTKGQALQSGRSVAGSTDTGLKSVNMMPSGQFAGQGFVSGVLSKATDAYNAGLTLARETQRGLKDGGQEGSPWKTTMKSGGFAGEGLVIGIMKWIKKAANAGMALATAAYDAINADTKNMQSLGNKQGKTFIQGLKETLSAESKNISMPLDDIKLQAQNAKSLVDVQNGSVGTFGGSNNKTVTNNFTQNIVAPKSPSRIELYRDSKNLLNFIAQPTGGV